MPQNTLNNRHLPAKDFDLFLKYLKSNFDVVPLAKLFDLHRSKTIPKRRTVALTFDDGYLNNFTIALPLLEKHQLPATFYIISKSIEDPKYMSWPDIIDIITKHHKDDLIIAGHKFNFPGFFCEELQSDLQSYLKSLPSGPDATVQELGKQFAPLIERELQTNRELVQVVNAEELTRHSNNPLLEIGSHSHNHPNLANLSDSDQEFQLERSKEILENLCNSEIISFAFPDGSYNKSTINLALKAGYKNLAAVNYKFDENHSNPNLLSRFTVSNSTTWQSNVLRLARQFEMYGF